jgi:hypothetical protein
MSMMGDANRRLAIGLAVAVAVLFLLCGWLYWTRTWLAIEVAFAAEQTEIFDEIRTKALAVSNPSEIAGFLQYAVHYYPSGTKQQTGSQLDQIVERHRTNTVREIIAHLRAKTGRDLGDDPRQWLAEFVER